MKKILGLFLVLLFANNCQQNTGNPGNMTANQTADAANFSKLKLEQAFEAFAVAGLAFNRLSIYNPNTDPNKLLGKQNQYIEKAEWQESATGDASGKYTMESFNNFGDLQQRKQYLEANAQGQRIYSHKNILLRLSNSISPEKAAKYEQALKSL